MAERGINPITLINRHLLEFKEHNKSATDPGKKELLGRKMNNLKQVPLFMASQRGMALLHRAPRQPRHSPLR